MISIKRFLDRRTTATPQPDLVEALLQTVRLLLDSVATQMVRGRDTDFEVLRNTLSRLVRVMGQPQNPMSLLGISSDAVEALETYCQRTTGYFQQQNREKQSIVAMLTETVAELSGQTDASVTRLQSIEKQVERASELDDIRMLRSALGNCLLDIRESAAHQKSVAIAAAERVRERMAVEEGHATPPAPQHVPFSIADVDLIMPDAPDDLVKSAPVAYVAAFKLQRAEHVASRFGEQVQRQMLSLLGVQLKTVIGVSDRLLRWKGTSFVMFIGWTGSIHELRAKLAEAVAATGQQYVEVGTKSALLSIGVDWMVFPQSEHPSLESVFAEIDAFLTNRKRETTSPVMMQR